MYAVGFKLKHIPGKHGFPLHGKGGAVTITKHF